MQLYFYAFLMNFSASLYFFDWILKALLFFKSVIYLFFGSTISTVSEFSILSFAVCCMIAIFVKESFAMYYRILVMAAEKNFFCSSLKV